jgi:UDP-N-acetylglucosamine--N-acetylmuramyl-(pentapeptide) pyrophosphoryl-undecaprenol N-acetylglucosamine transferase
VRQATRSVILAGGGTGGHVFPLLAVAEALTKLDPEIRPVFVGTPRGMETRLVPERGFELRLLDVLPMRGAGPSGFLRGAWRAARTLPDSLRLLRSLGALGVLSVGGYAAGPISLAAWMDGLPVALLEPNSVIGLSNRLIAPLALRAYTAFELTEAVFPPSVVRPLGVPIRHAFEPSPYQPLPSNPRVLVLGGSQGALSLNRTLPRALAEVQKALPGLRVVHQAGALHVEMVTEAYAEAGPALANVISFIDDMPAAIAAADLVIGRSGASAVSEIAAVGRPSLLLPYPFASGNHQLYNARALETVGAAVCLPSDTPQADLEREIIGLLAHPRRLLAMAGAARSFGRPQAALHVAQDFLDLLADGSAVAAQPARQQSAAEHDETLRFAEVA